MIDPTTLRLDMEPLILGALREDINGGDVSTNAVLDHAKRGQAVLLAKQTGVIAGLQVFARTFELLDQWAGVAENTASGLGPEEKAAEVGPVTVQRLVGDGDVVEPGQKLATVTGDLRIILSGERTALNYLQRMSGIASAANRMVKLLEGTGMRLVDTRKTSPNNRVFEKYAVRVGGAGNHRYNLSDGVLLKDNHIAAAGGVTQAIEAAKKFAPFVRKIEVETETLDQVREAVDAGADIIMLDNMTVDVMAKAVDIIAGRAQIEISGNVTEDRLASLRDLKIDFISSGALTHSAPVLDLSLKIPAQA